MVMVVIEARLSDIGNGTVPYTVRDKIREYGIRIRTGTIRRASGADVTLRILYGTVLSCPMGLNPPCGPEFEFYLFKKLSNLFGIFRKGYRHILFCSL
jgi:hypothetical protein